MPTFSFALRSLHIPQIVTSEVRAESDVYSHITLRRAIAELMPSLSFLWLRQKDQQSVDGFECLYEEPPLGDFYSLMAAADLPRLRKLFGWQDGLYPIDVVWCSRAGLAPVLSTLLATETANIMPVVITEPRVYGPGETGHNNETVHHLALRAAGYATCFGVYWSKWEKQDALDAASLYVSAGVLKDWEKRAHVVDALVDVPTLEIERPATPLRLLWAGRLNSNKRYQEIIAAYAQVTQSRAHDVETWVHSGTGAFNKLRKDDARWHHTSERLDRDTYWRLLFTSHVGAYLSHDEGANVTVQEIIASGVALALIDRPWVHRLFWPYRYPYLVKNAEELPALLDWLLDHWQEAYTRLTDIRNLILRERCFSAFCAKLKPVLDEVLSVPKPIVFRRFRKLTDEYVQTPLRFSDLRVLLKPYCDTRGGRQLNKPMTSMAGMFESVRDRASFDADPIIFPPQADEAPAQEEEEVPSAA